MFCKVVCRLAGSPVADRCFPLKHNISEHRDIKKIAFPLKRDGWKSSLPIPLSSRQTAVSFIQKSARGHASWGRFGSSSGISPSRCLAAVSAVTQQPSGYASLSGWYPTPRNCLVSRGTTMKLLLAHVSALLSCKFCTNIHNRLRNSEAKVTLR